MSKIKGNILIVDGIIEDLNFNGDASNYNVVECKEKIICPSFLDMRYHFMSI